MLARAGSPSSEATSPATKKVLQMSRQKLLDRLRQAGRVDMLVKEVAAEQVRVLDQPRRHRLTRLEDLLPGRDLKRAFQTFVHALLPRVLEAGQGTRARRRDPERDRAHRKGGSGMIDMTKATRREVLEKEYGRVPDGILSTVVPGAPDACAASSISGTPRAARSRTRGCVISSGRTSCKRAGMHASDRLCQWLPSRTLVSCMRGPSLAARRA